MTEQTTSNMGSRPVSGIKAKIANQNLLAARHDHIVAAATGLMLKQGFHKTTVRQIAEAAGWHNGMLYLHISTKEDILHLISQAIMRDLGDGLRVLPGIPDARDEFVTVVRLYFDTVERIRPKIALLYRESASLLPEHLESIKRNELENREFFASIIRRGVEEGQFTTITEPNLIAYDAIMLAHMWALKGWALRLECSFEQYKERQVRLLEASFIPVPQ